MKQTEFDTYLKMEQMPSSDGELVLRCLDGDEEAALEIVHRYQRLVFGIVYHYLGRNDLTEDLAQDVFLRFFQSLGRFDTSRPLKQWIARIASNRCLDELRKRKTQRVQTLSDLSQDDQESVLSIYESHSVSDQLSRGEAEKCFEILSAAMNALSEKDRMAFVLREIEGLEYSEIADIMKSSELAVRIRVSRSKKTLRSELEDLFE